MDKESVEQIIKNKVAVFIAVMNNDMKAAEKHWHLEEQRDQLWYYLGEVIQEMRTGGNK